MRYVVSYLLMLFLLVGVSYAKKWDLATGYPESNYHTKNVRLFAEAIKTATSGDLVIEVHSNGSLFKGNEIKRAVQTGQVQIGERLLSAHANENAIFETDSLPFLATSFEDSAKLYGIFKKDLEKILDKQNLVLLYSVPWPPQGLYSKRPLNSIEDMKGLKLRSYNQAIANIATLAGAQPIQIEAAELSQALASGVADSFVSSGSTGYDIKAWESLGYYYKVNSWLPRNYVVVNKKTWNGIDESTQNIIKAMAVVTEKAASLEAEKLTNWYLAEFAKNGMKVLEPSKSLKNGLKDIGNKLIADWYKKTGTDGKNIVKAFNSSK